MKKELSKKIKEFIEDQEWIFAKTYADTWPHEYIVQENVDNELFLDLANHIDVYGYDDFFYDTKQKYFKYDGLTYWHMGDIINRCTEENTYAYKKLHNILPDKK